LETHGKRPTNLIYLAVNMKEVGYVKIGRTTDMTGRLACYNIASPTKSVEIIWSKEVPKEDLKLAERTLRHLVGRHAVIEQEVNKKREWFQVPQKTAIEAASLLF